MTGKSVATVLLMTVLISGCALIRWRRATTDYNPPQLTYEQCLSAGYDCDCREIAVNLARNSNIWGGKASFRETLTDEGWERFQIGVKARGLSPACQETVIKAAMELPEGVPLPVNLLMIAAEANVYLLENWK